MKTNNDGSFYIPLADYIREFAQTDICPECNYSKYRHSHAYHDFSSDLSDQPMTFFKFRLNRQIDFRDEAFAISVSQQGDRLGRYRLKQNKFKPSRFNILLGKSDGTFVKANVGDDFLFSLDNEEVVLTPGEYIMMIDPIWNDVASSDRLY